MLIDELNRVPGIIQNQLLPITDRTIEIRGRSIRLGKEGYLYTIATGNPQSNGDYPGVFDEDIALLDRIPLIINFDEIPLAKGDRGKIGMMNTGRVTKEEDESPLTKDVVETFALLQQMRAGEADCAITNALLMEIVGNLFQYVEIGKKTVDKMQERKWRDMLKSGGHTGGALLAYTSEISTRTLKLASNLTYVLYKLVEIECKIAAKAKVGMDAPTQADYIRLYLECVKFAMNYDRRFIPDDLPGQLNKTHKEFIDGAFDDAEKSIIKRGAGTDRSNDTTNFEEAAMALAGFYDAFTNDGDIEEFNDYAQKGGKDACMAAALNIMNRELEDMNEGKREETLLDAIEEEK
jgi:hypothetical protein